MVVGKIGDFLYSRRLYWYVLHPHKRRIHLRRMDRQHLTRVSRSSSVRNCTWQNFHERISKSSFKTRCRHVRGIPISSKLLLVGASLMDCSTSCTWSHRLLGRPDRGLSKTEPVSNSFSIHRVMIFPSLSFVFIVLMALFDLSDSCSHAAACTLNGIEYELISLMPTIKRRKCSSNKVRHALYSSNTICLHTHARNCTLLVSNEKFGLYN